MAVSFADGVSVKRSERGLGLFPRDIVADQDARGRSPFGVTQEAVTRLVHSIRTEGQKQNIVIRKLPDGWPSVKAGYTRLAACTVIAQDDPEFRVWCTLETGNEEDSFRTTLIENLERNDLSDVDHAYNHETLRRKYGKTDKEIAEFYQWNASKVSRLKKLLLLPEFLQQKVHVGEISSASGFLLSELTPEEQAKHVESGQYLVSQLEETVRNRGKLPAVSTPVRATEPREQEEQDSDAPALDFSAVKTNDSEVASKPNQRTRQRTAQQVKDLLERYTTNDTHVTLRVFCSGLLDYQKGVITDAEFTALVQQLEGKKR